MAIPLRLIEVELEQPVEDCSVLEGQVAHIERDVAELKVDVRRLDTKVDAIGNDLAVHRAETERSFGILRADMVKGFGEARAEIVKVDWSLRAEMEKSNGLLRADMERGFGQLRSEMKDIKVWMLTWAIATTIAALTLSFNVARFLQAPVAAAVPANAPAHATP
jgi:hypothetical protein